MNLNTNISVRKASLSDLDGIMEVIADAKSYLKECGVDQWQDDFPSVQDIRNDMAYKSSFVIVEESSIVGFVCVAFGTEPSYEKPFSGKFELTGNYATIHRTAIKRGTRGKGLSHLLFDICEKECIKENIANVRIDTHADNKIMRHVIEKEGYRECAVVVIEDGTQRIAYEKDISAKLNTQPFQNVASPFDANYLPSGLPRLDAQMRFTAEIDKMTHIARQTLLIDGSRRENDAEHSWHLAVMAQIFQEYAVRKPNVERVVKMVVVHDLIEIYAGDTFAYDDQGAGSKEDREKLAADKLFAILPKEQGLEIRSLWEEFDKEETADACYAAALDSLQPFLHNTLTLGQSWKCHKVKKSAVLKRQDIVRRAMPDVWPWLLKNIDNAVKNGWLIDE